MCNIKSRSKTAIVQQWSELEDLAYCQNDVLFHPDVSFITFLDKMFFQSDDEIESSSMKYMIGLLVYF